MQNGNEVWFREKQDEQIRIESCKHNMQGIQFPGLPKMIIKSKIKDQVQKNTFSMFSLIAYLHARWHISVMSAPLKP